MKLPWETSLDFVLGEEGGYVDDPRDAGGATNRGITIGTLRRQGAWGDLDRDGDVDKGDVKLISIDDAARIYRAEYWAVVKGDELPGWLALMAFDGAVNMGPRTSVMLMQMALNVKPDGVIGPRTLAIAARANPVDTLRAFSARRGHHYGTRATFSTFGHGWMRRLIGAHDAAHGLIP